MEIEFLNKMQTPFPFDIERIIDDFVFLSVFVGNDFIPEQTGFDMRGGYFDTLIEIYQDVLANDCNDYITYAGRVNWVQAEMLFSALANY